ncbi:Alanine--tRNA ligase [Bienertia sinuspersici]
MRIGGFGSYLVPAAAVGAMGYCYMWWKIASVSCQNDVPSVFVVNDLFVFTIFVLYISFISFEGWSFSDVMFVTKQNMANAVASVSKQLDSLNDALATTKKHLSKRLETLDWKLVEQKEISGQILNDVTGVKSNISQIGSDIEFIREMVDGLDWHCPGAVLTDTDIFTNIVEGKLELLEGKQDLTNSGVYYLCKLREDVGAKLDPPKVTCEDNSRKVWLAIPDRFNWHSIAEKPIISSKIDDPDEVTAKDSSPVKVKTRLHRSYPVGLSLARDIL